MRGRLATAISFGLLWWVLSHLFVGAEPENPVPPVALSTPEVVKPVQGDSTQIRPRDADDITSVAVSVPAGASVLIGNLDVSGGIHQIELDVSRGQCRDCSTNAPFSDVIDLRHLLRNSASPAQGIPEMSPATGLDGPRQTAGDVNHAGDIAPLPDAAQIRRFRVPLFTEVASCDRYILAQRAAVSERIQVFVEESMLLATTAERESCVKLAREVCRLAENEVLDGVESRVGPVFDFDNDGRLTVVITHLTERPTDSAWPITGCVRGEDFQSECRPFGGDIVYLDRGLEMGGNLQAILAHEFSHACVFSAAAAVRSSDSEHTVPRWLNEAIAHVVELEMCPDSANLQPRFEQFFARSSSSPVVLSDSVTSSAERRGSSRAAACSFLATLLHNCPSVSVEDLIVAPGTGVEKLTAASGDDFPSLFRAWSLGLHRRELPFAVPLIPHRFGLSGTSLRRFSRVPEDCILTVKFAPDAHLQITVVGGEDQNRTTAVVPEPALVR